MSNKINASSTSGIVQTGANSAELEIQSDGITSIKVNQDGTVDVPEGLSINGNPVINDIVNVKKFGAKGDGITDDTAAFQSAINSVVTGSNIELHVSAGIYNLGTNVVSNGRVVSWRIDTGASFSGAGTLPSINTDNYGDKGLKNSIIAAQRGTAGTPNTDPGAMMILKKVSDAIVVSEQNATVVFAIEKRDVTTTDSRALAVFGEALDYSGGLRSFVEGGRFHGILKVGSVNGGGYGSVSVGGAEDNVDFDYLIGHEAVIVNKTSDAPTIGFFDKGHYTACYVATSSLGGNKKVDVGFITNPFTTPESVMRTGFMVAEDSVDDTAFGLRANVVIGLDLSTGNTSYAAIKIGNAEPIRVTDAAGTGDLNVFVVNSSDQLVLGTQGNGIVVGIRDTTYSNHTMKEVIYGAADSGGAGWRLLLTPN